MLFQILLMLWWPLRRQLKSKPRAVLGLLLIVFWGVAPYMIGSAFLMLSHAGEAGAAFQLDLGLAILTLAPGWMMLGVLLVRTVFQNGNPAELASFLRPRIIRPLWWLCVGLIVRSAVLLVLGLSVMDLTALVMSILWGGVGVIGLRSLRRRQRADQVAQDILSDPRCKPVLYLRNFRSDDSAGADMHQQGMPDMRNLSPQIMAAASPLMILQLEQYEGTFDARVAKAIERTLGPFIAIGDPRDFFPSEGAPRAYFTDSRWRANVQELIGRARAVILMVDDSPGLLEELELLRKLSHYDHILFFTGPQPFNEKRWQSLRESWSRTGWQLPEQPPREHSILRPGPEGTITVVATRALAPDVIVALLSGKPLPSDAPGKQVWRDTETLGSWSKAVLKSPVAGGGVGCLLVLMTLLLTFAVAEKVLSTGFRSYYEEQTSLASRPYYMPRPSQNPVVTMAAVVVSVALAVLGYFGLAGLLYPLRIAERRLWRRLFPPKPPPG